MPETEYSDWYVAVTRLVGSNFCTSLIGAGSKYYKNFKETAKRNGIEIVAEQFDVTDEVINRLDGFNKGKKSKKIPLKELVDKLNSGEQLNVQEELKKLCVVRLKC